MNNNNNNKIKLNWNFDYEFNGEQHSKTKYVIYKIENTISGKIYIGQTRRKLFERWRSYKNDLLKPIQTKNYSGSNIKLKYSVQKHYKQTGNVEFLKFSIVEIVDVSNLNSEEEKKLKVDEREKFYIEEYRNLFGKDKIYNTLEEGRTHVFTDKDRKTMSTARKYFFETEEGKLRKQKLKKRFSGERNPMYGKKHTEESIKKNRESNLGKQVGEKNAMYGKKHSEEAKLKMSLAHKGKPSSVKGTKRPEMAGMKKNLLQKFMIYL